MAEQPPAPALRVLKLRYDGSTVFAWTGRVLRTTVVARCFNCVFHSERNPPQRRKGAKKFLPLSLRLCAFAGTLFKGRRVRSAHVTF